MLMPSLEEKRSEMDWNDFNFVFFRGEWLSIKSDLFSRSKCEKRFRFIIMCEFFKESVGSVFVTNVSSQSS